MRRIVEKDNILKLLEYLLILLSGCIFLCGKICGNLTAILIGTLFLYLSGFIYCIGRPGRRIIALFLYITIFVFLLSRPTISMFRQNEWWYYGKEACNFTLTAIYISLVSIYVGCRIVEGILFKKGYYDAENTPYFFEHDQRQTEFNYSLRLISGIGYYISLFFDLIKNGYTLAYMIGRDYAEIYLGTGVSVPFYIQAISVLMPYFLCVYLATLPKKSASFLALSTYVLSMVPMLIIGARNGIVLAVILAVVYFVIRDYLDGTKYWIGKFEKICIVIAIPLGLAFLGYYNYMREGQTVENANLISLLIDFFYKQGVSFDVMCIAHNSMDDLPNVVPKCYTFGGIIDYFKHGLLARELFGAISLDEGNNAIKAIYGNSFAHSLAYVAEPNYLNGHGMGSSYILETFVDWGYWGVAAFSAFLSGFISTLIPLFKKCVFSRIILLNCLLLFFLIPRAEATGWMNFIVYAQFWVVVAFSYVMANFLLIETKRNKSRY